MLSLTKAQLMHPAPGKNRWWGTLGLLLVLGGAVLWFSRSSGRQNALPTVTRTNGQQWIIEAVTYRTNVVLGKKNYVRHWFGRWLPASVTEFFSLAREQTIWSREEQRLVVWLNGFDPAKNQFIDCQDCRLELIDEQGHAYPATPSWYSFPRFSRVAHEFPTFPRRQRLLTLKLIPTSGTEPYTLFLTNPAPVQSVPTWTPSHLPVTHRDRGIEIRLTGFTLESESENSPHPTNSTGVAPNHWRPIVELHQNGVPAGGWSPVEWVAEDPSGNQGQTLDPHEPVQRIRVQAYPASTNAELASVGVQLPKVQLNKLGTGLEWSLLTITSGPVVVRAIGVFPPGIQFFADGHHTTNLPPVPMAAAIGNSRGWTSLVISAPNQRKRSWDRHNTSEPTLYLNVPPLPDRCRVGLRVRDEQGRLWPTEPEEQGQRQNIQPFHLRLPPDVQVVTPEVVFLRPITAEFTVEVPKPQTERSVVP